MNNQDIPWAIYTGEKAPFRSENPIYCAWHSHHAVFASELAPKQFIAVCGHTQIGGTSLENVQKSVWKFAENNLGGTIVPRAHIMNFRKVES